MLLVQKLRREAISSNMDGAEVSLRMPRVVGDEMGLVAPSCARIASVGKRRRLRSYRREGSRRAEGADAVMLNSWMWSYVRGIGLVEV